MKKILIIAAHPDDEVLGCGGTVARLIKEGNEAYTAILGEGVTGRDELRDSDNRKNEIKKLQKDLKIANRVLGIKRVIALDIPDNRFDTVPFLEIVKKVEKIKNELRPDIVFTHFKNDLNIDHRITYEAVLTATRPMADEGVKEIYSFEILSSTEWNFPPTFNPNTFYDISSTVGLKIKAMEKYKNEIRKYPHPRSVEGININAKYWGLRTGLNLAEAFIRVRSVN